jgi:hypothetical protein
MNTRRYIPMFFLAALVGTYRHSPGFAEESPSAAVSNTGDCLQSADTAARKSHPLLGKWKSTEIWRTIPIERASSWDDADGCSVIITKPPADPEGFVDPDAEYMIEIYRHRDGKKTKLPDSDPGVIDSGTAYLGPIGSCFVFKISSDEGRLILHSQVNEGEPRVRIVLVPDR